MARIDIFSGFLGAGKTTLIRKLIAEGFKDEKLVLIENEFGEISIDGGFLKDAGVEITEMNSGCICCTLVGDFTKALRKVMDSYSPDRVIIEPSGVGKLSDIAKAVQRVEGAHLGAKVTVVDAGKCKMYMRNFGEFYNDQVENADIIVMSRTDTASEAKIMTAAELLKEHNPGASLITTPWDKLNGRKIKEAMDEKGLEADIRELSCCDEEHEHGHCHEHDHEHCHHHHHADEIFGSFGMETPAKYEKDQLEAMLRQLKNEEYGSVLRAKGILDCTEGDWLYFDYVPGEIDIRRGEPEVTGRLCVIGSGLNETKLKELFRL